MALEVPGMKRHVDINHFNYTEHDFAEKKLAMHNLKIMYPDVSQYHASLVYDMCKNCTPEEIEALKIKADQPFKYNYTGLQEELDKIKQDLTFTVTGVTNENDNEDIPESENDFNSESE
ncbi:hypothetical protein [Chrysochromulina parva virophage Larry]|nr:hypothetical protein [Chrysochromulina parva virophage Larry]